MQGFIPFRRTLLASVATMYIFEAEGPAGMADGTNRYAYAGGNPVNRIDPSGMRVEESGGWIGGMGSGGASVSASWIGPVQASVSVDDWWGRCGPAWGIFLLGAAMSIIGVYVKLPRPQEIAWVLWAFNTNIYSVTTANDVGARALAVFILLWDLLYVIFEKLTIGAIQGFFERLGAWAQISTNIVPGALMIKWGVAAFTIGLGLAGLHNQRCFA